MQSAPVSACAMDYAGMHGNHGGHLNELIIFCILEICYSLGPVCACDNTVGVLQHARRCQDQVQSLACVYIHVHVHCDYEELRPAICVACAWRVMPTLPGTPAQLLRPGIG